MALIDPGKKAPAFSLPDQAGTTHSLADYAGQPVVVYFYPKDDTPGCTKESCAFQDNLPKFKTSKAAVLGVSILDEASKARFADKYKLTFPLLADADHEVQDAIGLLGVMPLVVVPQDLPRCGVHHDGLDRCGTHVEPDDDWSIHLTSTGK